MIIISGKTTNWSQNEVYSLDPLQCQSPTGSKSEDYRGVTRYYHLFHIFKRTRIFPQFRTRPNNNRFYIVLFENMLLKLLQRLINLNQLKRLFSNRIMLPAVTMLPMPDYPVYQLVLINNWSNYSIFPHTISPRRAAYIVYIQICNRGSNRFSISVTNRVMKKSNVEVVKHPWIPRFARNDGYRH